MSVDELDLKIMQELEDDARQTVQALANKLGTKRTTTRNRLNRLIDENILSVSCITSPEALGYQYVLIIGMNVPSEKVDAVAKKLVQLPSIGVVYLSVGRYNILTAAILKDRLALKKFVSESMGNISDIPDVEMMHSFERIKNSWRYFKPQMESFDKYPPAKPNEFDLSIIKAIQLDPRQTITKLAKTVGCSKSVAKTRLESLVNDGIIRFVSLVDPTALGYDIGVLILIKSESDKTYSVANELSMLHIASHVSLTTSQWQIIVLAQFHSSRHMDLCLSEILPSIPGIIKVEIVHLLKTLKYSPNSGWFGYI